MLRECPIRRLCAYARCYNQWNPKGRTGLATHKTLPPRTGGSQPVSKGGKNLYTELAPQGRSGSSKLITQDSALSTERVLHQKLTTDGSFNCLNNMQPFQMDQACQRNRARK